MISRAKSIAMTNKEMLAIELVFLRVVVHGDVKFLLEVVSHPHVVVTNKKRYRDATVGDFGQPAEQPCVSLRNHRFVFVPEVEDIADNKYMRCIKLCFFKEGNNMLFSL